LELAKGGELRNRDGGREVFDVLPGRSAEETADWLRQHPNVEVVSRIAADFVRKETTRHQKRGSISSAAEFARED
jgi:hypothetical protein